MTAAPNGWQQATAESFGWKCPRGPDRPCLLDTVGDVEKGMDGEGTERQALRLVLVVEPCGKQIATVNIKANMQLIDGALTFRTATPTS